MQSSPIFWRMKQRKNRLLWRIYEVVEEDQTEKRKRRMTMVEMRKNMKRKRFEIPSSMLEKGGKISSNKPINGSTKMKKLNSTTCRKMLGHAGLKENKVSQGGDHVAASDASNECKFDSCEIEEYWVPVHLSHMQIEKYCSLLNSNLEALTSSLRDNSPLNDILTQTQKCCDHPYCVEPTLRGSLKTDLVVDQLDAEISVSGKLQLLDKLLLKIKQCGLRVLVLFQSLATKKDISIGDILDDLVDKRFGQDSYIRIHRKNILSSNNREKRKKDLEMFNDLESGKFLCLLDYRDCSRTIRLSSVDVVILFNSDWSPLNDIKALRKLSLDSKPLRVLQLYSSFTTEEKALILSKQGKIYDRNSVGISYNNCHLLLAWGASYLFSKLSNDPKSKSDTSFVDDLVHELSSLLLNKNGNAECLKSTLISNTQIHKGVYSTNILLLGESEEHLKESCSYLMEIGPLVFWTNLLKESPWKNSCSRSSRRVQKSFRSPCLVFDQGHEAEIGSDVESFQNHAITPPSMKARLTSKRRMCTEAEQSTNDVAECTNNKPQQPQTLPVFPPVSDQSCSAAPFETELENINKEREQVTKLHEEKKSMLLSEREKAILEIGNKYDALIHESEICLTKILNVLEQRYALVYANKVLADTLTPTCDDAFNGEKPYKETGAVRIPEIPASVVVQSDYRCTSSIPTLCAPAPHLRSSSSLFASLPTLSTPQTQTELNNVDNEKNTEKVPVVQSYHSWDGMLAELDSILHLPFLDSN